MHIKIGPIKNIVLLGGGELLSELAIHSAKEGLNVLVLTSPRHAGGEVDGIPLLNILKSRGIPTKILEKVDRYELSEILSDMATTFALSIGAAWIFTENIIKNCFQYRLYNCHNSLLPINRGGGGFSWQRACK